jgi:hypothetical protein
MPVNLEGVKGTISAMRKIDPELLKEMNAEIKAVMIPIRNKARGYAPSPQPDNLYGWSDMAQGNKITAKTSAFRESTLDGQVKRLFPLYNADVVRKGIYYAQAPSSRNRNGWRALYYVANRSAAGAIYETAGRVNPGGSSKSRSTNPGAGAHFVSRMGPLYGSDRAERGRMIFRAWDEDQGKAQNAVIRAITNTVNAFNQGRYAKAA